MLHLLKTFKIRYSDEHIESSTASRFICTVISSSFPFAWFLLSNFSGSCTFWFNKFMKLKSLFVAYSIWNAIFFSHFVRVCQQKARCALCSGNIWNKKPEEQSNVKKYFVGVSFCSVSLTHVIHFMLYNVFIKQVITCAIMHLEAPRLSRLTFIKRSSAKD